MRLENKVVVITGAGRGLGKSLALGMSKEGASVAVADIDSENAAATAEEINQEGGKAFSVAVDVSDSSSVQGLLETVLAKHNRVDVLVNNAGVVSHSSFFELPEEEWDRVLNTNLKGIFLCTQRIAPSMISRKGGSIINISSVAADLPTPDYVPYGVSKAGILQLTKTLAVLLAPHNIRVNAIQPGTVLTPMNVEALSDPEVRHGRLKQIPLNRIGTTEEVVGPAIFLASDEARYITGASLVVDGGSLLVR